MFLSNAYSLLSDHISPFVNMIYIDICTLNQPCNPMIDPIWSWIYFHLVKIVASMFKRYWSIILFSCLVLVAGQYGLQNICWEVLVITFLFLCRTGINLLQHWTGFASESIWIYFLKEDFKSCVLFWIDVYIQVLVSFINFYSSNILLFVYVRHGQTVSHRSNLVHFMLKTVTLICSHVAHGCFSL